MRKENTANEYSVTGIILANGWDENGNITEVAIFSDNEEIYLVGKNECGQGLLNTIQKEVKVEGKIIQQTNGHKRIEIRSIQIIPAIDNHINESSIL